jgi:hypothetical protein
MQAAATSERERLDREIERIGTRLTRLYAEAHALEKVADELGEQRELLNHFAEEVETGLANATRRLSVVPDEGSAPGNRVTVLRGARIRETAVRVLAAHTEPEVPVHYRDWFNLLTAQGFMPAGKDPLATFLTQIGRSPVVRRSTSAGTYVLDPQAVKRIRARLAQLTAELAALPGAPPVVTVEEIASARERRAQLTAQLHETERQLQEALRSLGDDTAAA